MEIDIDLGSVVAKVETFIRDRVASAGKSCGIVGLSGGVDSTVTAYLCRRALGRENVRGVIIPYSGSRPDSVIDAGRVVDVLGIQSSTVNISDAEDACVGICPGLDRLRKGNIVARLRMIVLYDQAYLHKGLVVGTTNKTELLLGYYTKYGDGGVDIEPIADLYKTRIWQLAAHLGVPREIIEKVPTADLWEGQTDEGELGFTYREVDRLLCAMYEEGLREEEILARGFNHDFVETVRSIISSSAHKRAMPPVAEL